MLVIAGIIEGFFSPTAEPVLLKFSIATGLFLLLIVYLNGGWSGNSKLRSQLDEDCVPTERAFADSKEL